jgi:hypothetical protein
MKAGSTPVDIPIKGPSSVLQARCGQYSEKPEEFYDVARRTTAGRGLDMFQPGQRRRARRVGQGSRSVLIAQHESGSLNHHAIWCRGPPSETPSHLRCLGACHSPGTRSPRQEAARHQAHPILPQSWSRGQDCARAYNLSLRAAARRVVCTGAVVGAGT